MGLEVENLSGDVQTNVITTPSTASISGPKTFTFAKRSGFVIPKNKLSGSLVPAFRAIKKAGGDPVKEEAPIQVLRKTKWGPDLTLDATVRKGRALAYQVRGFHTPPPPSSYVMLSSTFHPQIIVCLLALCMLFTTVFWC